VKDRGLGTRLRNLRAKTGLGIKKVAPELGISYTYLSKLENDEKKPSEELIARIADYYGDAADELLVAAGRVPAEVLSILQRDPEKAIAFLRQRFGPKQRS
jgi:HTH-type transcriptional regulator, competence development regulator